jgi:GNAT superfamily N-acetyltransferase
VAARPEALLLLAYVDGKPAGTGELVCEDSVAWLSADATLPQFRGRGVQTALQRERLRIAAKEGCELAVTESTPGSASQRNMHRHGFVVLYTRVDLIGPASVSGRTS